MQDILLNLLFTGFSNKIMTDNLKFEHISNTTQNFTRVLPVYPETTFSCDPERQEENRDYFKLLLPGIHGARSL